MSTPANGGDKINFQNPISFENDEDAEEDEEDDELVESSAAAKMAPPKSPRESEKSFEQDPGTGAEPSTPVLNVLNTPESQERELDKTVLLNKVWGTFDIDGNGSLDAGEIQMVLTHMGMDANEETVQSAMQRMNTSRKGQVDFPEFAKWFEENDSEDKQYDFFTIFSNALELLAGAAESRMEIREHMKQCFKDVPDWSAQLDQASFCNTLESHLKIQLDADMREALVVEVHSGPNAQGDADSGTFTILEFETWWDHFFEYDAVDPFRAALLALEESNVISPNSNFRGNWDLVQAALLAYIAFALPYRLGFSDAIEFLSGWFWWDLLVDIYFIADLFLNFRTAVLTPDGQLLYEQKDIARAYLRGWFTIDFASCLPFGYVEYFVDKDEGSKGSSNKAVRMLRLFRLLKLLRLVRIKRILDRWEEEMYGARALKIGKLIAAVSVFAHWGACTWYFVGAPVETEEYLLANNISDKDDVIGLGREVAPGWVFSRYGGAVLLDENDEGYVGYGQRYFDSVFWSAMSVLTIQNEDEALRPSSVDEKLAYMISFLVGVFLMATIIGQVSDMIAHANPGDVAKSDAVGLAHAFMHEKKIAPSLTRRVRQHYSQYYTNRGTTMDIQEFMDSLPYDLALELGEALNFTSSRTRRSVMAKVPFLGQLSNDDLIKVGCKLRYVTYNAPVVDIATGKMMVDGFIMKQGDRGKEMFIVLDGMVRIERLLDPVADPNGEPENLGKLVEGDYFGELAVLIQESPGLMLKRSRSAYSITNTAVLYSLNWADLQTLRQMSPQIEETISRAVQKLRRNQPSLFVSVASGTAVRKGDSEVGLEDKVDKLDQKVDALATQIADLTKLLARSSTSS